MPAIVFLFLSFLPRFLPNYPTSNTLPGVGVTMVAYCNVSKEQLCCHPRLLVPDLDYRTTVPFLITITWGKCSAVPRGELGIADNTARENTAEFT